MGPVRVCVLRVAGLAVSPAPQDQHWRHGPEFTPPPPGRPGKSLPCGKAFGYVLELRLDFHRNSARACGM